MRLIDADALHEALKAEQRWIVRCGDKYNEGYTYDQVHFAIDDAPTIDAVPVADHYEILLAEKAGSWKEGFDAGIKAERLHNETVEELARNGYQEDE